MAILISAKDKASAESEGLVRFATSAEATTGTRADVAMSPALVKAQLDGLSGNAPADLDSFEELAAAINNDANFHTTVQDDIDDLQTQINTLAGGNIGGLQDEIDDTQAGAGLDADGGYTADNTTNYITAATSLKNADFRLDAQIKQNADDIAALGNGNLSALQTEVDSIESSVGLSTAGAYVSRSGTNYLDSATSIVGEISALDTQLKSTQDDLDTAESNITSLQTSLNGKASQTDLDSVETLLDTHETSIGLSAAGAYVSRSGSNYLDSATSIVSEIGLLDAQVSTNATDITNINTTINDLTSEGDTNSDAITALQNEVNTTQSGAGLSVTGAYTAPGSSNYLGSATSLKSADDLLDAQIKTNADNIASNDTDIASNTTAIAAKAAQTDVDALETLADTHESSIGLSAAGAYVSRSGTNYLDSATSIVGEISALDTQLKSTQDDLDTAEASISSKASQSELDATQSGAGLNANGTYTADGSSNYISGVASLKAADSALDSQIKTNADAISSNDTDISGLDSRLTTAESDIDDLEALADTHEASIGLTAAGAYQAPANSNYLGSASSVRDADSKLDAQIKTNADNITSNDTDISTLNTLADTHETSLGLNADGSRPNYSSTNYITNSSSVVSAVGAIDSQVGTNATNISTNSTDIDTLEALADTHETAIGLNANGTFNGFSGSNYIDSSTSVRSALSDLDSQLGTTQSDLDTEEAARASADSTLTSAIDTVEASVGLTAAGAYQAPAGSNYLGAATSVRDADSKLDAQIKTNADAIALKSSQTELDTTQASVGLSADGSKTNYANTNYIDNADTLKEAIEALDAQVSTNATDIAGVSGGSISALQSEVDATQTGAGLATNGTYSANGSANFIASSTSLKDADDDLDTALKSEETARIAADAALDTRMDARELRDGGIFLDVPASSAVEMDATLTSFRSHLGPFEINLFSLLDSFPDTDIIFYGCVATTHGDAHFLPDGSGNVDFTGNR